MRSFKPTSTRSRSRGLSPYAVPAALVLAAACTGVGDIDGLGGRYGTDASAPGTETPDGSASLKDEGVSPLRALTPYELQNSMKDLFGDDANELRALQPAAVKRGVEALGGDGFLFTGSRADQLEDLLYSIATRLSQGEGQYGVCARAADDFSCLRAAYTEVLPRLYRHPVDAGQLEALVKIASDNVGLLGRQDAIARSLEGALLAPDFLYLTNLGPEGTYPGVMTPFELASRMAFTIWSSVPDAELVSAAAAGGLTEQAGIEAQAQRLLADPKSSRGISRFVLGWSDALSLASRNKGGVAEWTPEIASDALTETRSFVEAWWKGPNPTFANLLVADHTFVNARLASYYGLPAPAGDGFQKVQLAPGSGRGGLLTQATFLAATTGSAGTSPTQRGRWVQERGLCRIFNAPADTQAPDGPVHKDGDQVRDFHERLMTAGCSTGCHMQLEPPGFVFEAYDGIGRTQTMEQGRPIRTDATLQTASDLDATYANAAGLIGAMSTSNDVRTCVASFFAAHGLGRNTTGNDAALTTSLQAALATDARQAMLLLVSSPTFRAAVKP